ncbi:MAG: nucleotidyltransferase domain-containing protein [Anaerolineae bacterium]
MTIDQITPQPETILSDQFLNDIVGVFKDHLGPDLVAIVLYGSWARGESRPGSDVDLLVIARNLPCDRFERVTYVHRMVVGRFRRRISVLAKEPAEFEGYFPSLYLDIGLDGIILYDLEGYMTGKLARIRELIEEAGLYRVRRDGELMWLWKRQPAHHWAIEWDGFHESSG